MPFKALFLLALLTIPVTGHAQRGVVALNTSQVEANATEAVRAVPKTSDETAEEAKESAVRSTVTVITQADCPEGFVCVKIEDMAKVLHVLRERQCLQETEPTFDISEVKIIIDKDRRVYYTGSGPESKYIVTMKWCPFTVTAEGEVKMNVGIMEPPVWGFRFRPKAYMGYIPLLPFFDGNGFSDGVDAGLMVDFVHYRWANLNVALGFKSFGLGVGVDITKNFGGYAGYGMIWKPLFQPTSQAPLHSLVVGIDFAF